MLTSAKRYPPEPGLDGTTFARIAFLAVGLFLFFALVALFAS